MISSWTLHIVKAIDYKLVKRFHDLTPLLIPNIWYKTCRNTKIVTILRWNINIMPARRRKRTSQFWGFVCQYVMFFYKYLSYHQGCISCINYPSNKLSFIRRVLNKSRTHNSLGQRLVVVSSVFFLDFHSRFCSIRLMCKIFFKHVVDNNYVCHLIQYWRTAI